MTGAVDDLVMAQLSADLHEGGLTSDVVTLTKTETSLATAYLENPRVRVRGDRRRSLP